MIKNIVFSYGKTVAVIGTRGRKNITCKSAYAARKLASEMLKTDGNFPIR